MKPSNNLLLIEARLLSLEPSNPSQQSSTILPSNKVHYRAFSEAYGTLEQPSLNRGLTPSSRTLEQNTPFVRAFPNASIEPSNSLLLIEAQLISLKPSNKVHPLFDT